MCTIIYLLTPRLPAAGTAWGESVGNGQGIETPFKYIAK